MRTLFITAVTGLLHFASRWRWKSLYGTTERVQQPSASSAYVHFFEIVITSEARNLLLIGLQQRLREQQIPHGLNSTPVRPFVMTTRIKKGHPNGWPLVAPLAPKTAIRFDPAARRKSVSSNRNRAQHLLADLFVLLGFRATGGQSNVEQFLNGLDEIGRAHV